jgi:hypothetical protein
MNKECVLRCEENYENRTEGDEYVCKPKECVYRTPFSNGSCSLKEDFGAGEGGSDVGCYLLRGNDEEMWTCVNEGDCPNGYPEVFSFFFLFFFFFNFFNFFFLIYIIYDIFFLD